MTGGIPIRRAIQAAALRGALTCAVLCATAVGFAMTGQQNNPPPVVRNQYSGQSAAPNQSPGDNNAPAFRAGVPVYHSDRPAGQRAYVGPAGHLGAWMQMHKNLNPQQQQEALEHEPGFRQLPAQEQKRVIARLQQLNAMPPEQRERVLARVESMEHLTPTERQVVTSTMGQLHALPPARQRAVAQVFRNLRQLPPDQRQTAADYYARQFSPQEREALNSLVRAEPYLPVQHPPAFPPPPPYEPQQ